jgi:hypothetical protein
MQIRNSPQALRLKRLKCGQIPQALYLGLDGGNYN